MHMSATQQKTCERLLGAQFTYGLWNKFQLFAQVFYLNELDCILIETQNTAWSKQNIFGIECSTKKNRKKCICLLTFEYKEKYQALK